MTPLSESRTYRLSGELVMSSADQLGEALGEDYESRGDITLDLSDLTFLDSSGLQVLIAASSRLGENGDLTLHAPNAAVQRMMEIVALDRVDNIHVIYHDEPGETADLPAEGL